MFLLGHAADAVQAVRAGRSLTDALAKVPAPARPGAQALSFHAMRWLGAARAVRARLAPKTPPPVVESLLLTALALLWPDGGRPYAEHVVVDQSVRLAGERAPASRGFVNAVLRRFLRERDAIVAAVQLDPEALHQHPRWWIDRLRQDWPEHWEALLKADNLHPPMTLRVNARRTSAEAYLQRLLDAGIEARVLGGQAIVLERPRPVSDLPGFADGEVSVQDAAAQRAAPLLLGLAAADPAESASGAAAGPAAGGATGRLAPGARVLDACAAPGGKSAHLLELGEIDLLALDSDAQRLNRVQETMERLGLRATLKAGDARQADDWWDGRPFDAILLDAPCSASGIVRRHPDARWLRRASDITALARTQAELLDALWPLLAPGGRLLYATCSIFRAEGVEQIDAFLQRCPDATPATWPISPGHLLPLIDNLPLSSGVGHPAEAAALQDGFFYALLEKS